MEKQEKLDLTWTPPAEPIVGRRYKHFKGGIFTVRGFLKHSDTAEWLVRCTDEQGHEHAFTIGEFASTIDTGVSDVGDIPRFALQPATPETSSHEHHWHLVLTSDPLGSAPAFYPVACCECGRKNYVRTERLSCMMSNVYAQSQGALGPACGIEELLKKDGL